MPWENKEKGKYVRIYASNPSSYGKRDHGSNAHEIVLDLKPKTLLDVGCGCGKFVEWAKENGIEAAGVDFASGYGQACDVCNMPFTDNSFDIITAFDLLEHLRPEDLHRALLEMARVASHFWVLSIGYGPAVMKWPGEVPTHLHPIAFRDPAWWTPHLSLYGTVEEKGRGMNYRPYLLVKLE